VREERSILYLVSPPVTRKPIMRNVIETLKHRLIVSCQAPANSPLNVPEIIAGMAWVCANQGVCAVRIDGPDRIRAVREILPDVLIVGLWKKTLPDSVVQITPRLKEAIAILDAGADAVAIDATIRRRPAGETVATIIEGIKRGSRSSEYDPVWIH
jgi:N-acylglucosamine-6-phosphate 2-epimerase